MSVYGERKYRARLPELNAETGLTCFHEDGGVVYRAEPDIKMVEYLLFAAAATLKELKARDAIAGSGINGKKIS